MLRSNDGNFTWCEVIRCGGDFTYRGEQKKYEMVRPCPCGCIKFHLKAAPVNLVLNNDVVFDDWLVMDSEIGSQGIDVLIGMDIISNGDFAISNYEGRTQFSFRLPSQEHVEYKRD